MLGPIRCRGRVPSRGVSPQPRSEEVCKTQRPTADSRLGTESPWDCSASTTQSQPSESEISNRCELYACRQWAVNMEFCPTGHEPGAGLVIPTRCEPGIGLGEAVGQLKGSLPVRRVDHRSDGDRYEKLGITASCCRPRQAASWVSTLGHWRGRRPLGGHQKLAPQR